MHCKINEEIKKKKIGFYVRLQPIFDYLNLFCNAILWPDFSHGRAQSSSLLTKPAGVLFRITYANLVLGGLPVGGF